MDLFSPPTEEELEKRREVRRKEIAASVQEILDAWPESLKNSQARVEAARQFFTSQLYIHSRN